MLSKVLLLFLMSFVFINSAMAGDGRDGPFPMFTADGVWQDNDKDLKVEITNGKLSRDQHFMSVMVKVYSADGSVFAQGGGLHNMLDSILFVQLRDAENRKLNLRMKAFYGKEKDPFPDGKYQLVMSITYVYEKGNIVDILSR